jgi:hypothetical protein
VSSSLRERILGTWILRSWVRTLDGVEEPGPFGPDALGQLVYSPDGHMSGNLMRRTRDRFATEDAAGPEDPRERAAAYDGYLGYCGRYEVDDAAALVLHRVELSSNPNWTGSVQRRLVEFIGTRMKLTTPPIVRHGKPAASVLVWDRAPAP